MNGTQVKNMSKANQAGIAARKKLIEAHQDEYDSYVREERISRGLPADPAEAKLLARREKLRRELEKIDGQLNS